MTTVEARIISSWVEIEARRPAKRAAREAADLARDARGIADWAEARAIRAQRLLEAA